jgi:uncharacterized protein
MKTISFPFRFDGYGKVATTSDMSRVWADRVRSVVSTYPGERLMRPDYGTAIPDDLFSAVYSSPEFIDAQVANSFAAWLAEVNLVGVNYMNAGLSEVSLQIEYVTPNLEPNSDTMQTITI